MFIKIIMGAGTPGRRCDTLHEHALMRRAAHTDFPRNDRSAKLEFETFFFMKAMSLDLSIGVYCVTSVSLSKCCGFNLAVPKANNPTPSFQRNYPNCRTDTLHQPKRNPS